jgi:hypothetical protein
MQIVWSERGVQKFAGSVKAVELQLVHFCEDDSIAEVSRGEERKKVSGGNGDTLWRNALKRAESAVCG